MGCTHPEQFQKHEQIISGQLSTEINELMARCHQAQPIDINQPLTELDESNKSMRVKSQSSILGKLQETVRINISTGNQMFHQN